MRSDQLQRRPRHRDPDIHQHEIHRSIDLPECLAQVAFAQIDETAQAGLLEMRPCRACLVGLVFGADHHAVAAAGADIVARGCREIERRDRVGCADLDDPARIICAAKLVAELRLVTIERDKLVAEKGPGLLRRRRLRLPGPTGIEAPHRRGLLVASGMQAGEQAFQLRIANNTHGLLATAGTLISVGRMIAAAITNKHSAANACSMVTKPPCSYSHATRRTDTPAAVKPMK